MNDLGKRLYVNFQIVLFDNNYYYLNKNLQKLVIDFAAKKNSSEKSRNIL